MNDTPTKYLRRWLWILPALVFAVMLCPAAWGGEAHEAGRAIYNYRCYFCHGYSGDARTLAARFLQPRPRNFTTLSRNQLSREAMVETITRGRPGTAMKPFAGILSAGDIAAVADFIRIEFMGRPQPNTRYHTPGNGWPDHQRYAPAFPFATGELPLDTPWTALNEAQRRGLGMYFDSCISCHDRSHVREGEVMWERQALSFPRFDFRPGDADRPPDAITGASPFARHDIPPPLPNPTPRERIGETLFQDNCAFCHGADGTGKNWIGTFLQPHPRDLTSPVAMKGMTRESLMHVIRDGIPGSSMPAWKDLLAPGEIFALTAYISKVFHPLPAGKSEPATHVHDSQSGQLKFIRR